MIGWLRGRLVTAEPGGPVLVDVNGVGYELFAPVGSVERARKGDAVELYVHTHVREDALDLFGFATATERRAFRVMLQVPNVGPKTALGVLSALTVSELADAVAGSDLGRLSKVPGIGKKTAERLVLELKDKLLDEGGPPERPGGTGRAAGGKRAQLVSALTNMGYRPGEAEKAVSSIGQRVDSAPLAELLRDALAELSQA